MICRDDNMKGGLSGHLFFVVSVVVPFLQFVVHAISRPLPVGPVGVDDELQETDYIL